MFAGQIGLPHVLPFVPCLGGNNQVLTEMKNNIEASYVNNEVHTRINVMGHIGYQPTITTTIPLVDHEMIAETMKEYFAIQLKPTERPMYKNRHPKQVDHMTPLPKGFKIPYFTTFSDEDGKSTMVHIVRFTTQCGEVGQNEIHKLQLFPLSFTEVSLTWYSTIADLMNMKQLVDKLVMDFIERFRKDGNRCLVKLPEIECATMVVGNMRPQLKEKLVA